MQRGGGDVLLRRVSEGETCAQYRKYLSRIVSSRERVSGCRFCLKYADLYKSGLFYRMFVRSDDHGDWLLSKNKIKHLKSRLLAESMNEGDDPSFCLSQDDLLCFSFLNSSRLRAEFFEWRKTFYGI